MWRKIILKIISLLYKLTYESVTLDKVNRKLIRPVPGLIVNGKQYWEYCQIADMPEARRVHFSYMREEISMGIDRELLLKFIGQIKEANAAGDVNKIGFIVYMLEDIIKNITTVESLYNLASLAYFDRTEDISTYDLDYAQAKIEAFKKMPDEAKGFFFSRLLQNSLKISGESLPQDIVQFLKENGAKLSAYMRMASVKTELKD